MKIKLQVFAKDVDGRQKFIKQPFSMDGTRGMSFGFLPKVALMTDASCVVSNNYLSNLLS